MATRVNKKKKSTNTTKTKTKSTKAKSPRRPAGAADSPTRGLTAAPRAQLEALDDAKLNRPTDISVPTIAIEAKELVRILERVGEKIAARSRVEAADLTALPRYIARAEAAQYSLQSVRRRTASPELIEARSDAEAIEEPLFAELRYFLADDSDVQVRLDEIQVGDDDPDTVQDLRDLADLFEPNRAKLKKAGLPADVATRARQAADTLEALITDKSGDDVTATAMALRNRAYWSLRAVIDHIREGGRHVFRDDPRRLKWFRASSTRAADRTVRGRSRKAKKDKGEPTDT